MLRPTANNVLVLHDYMLKISFDNGEERIFNAAALFNRKAFKPLKNKNLFNQVKPNGISIEWPPDIDVCPDELYFSSVPL